MTAQATFNYGGCFAPGAVFNIWVNPTLATNAYMAPYAVTIDPTASWCNFDFGGTVDSLSTTFSTGSQLTPVSCSNVDLQTNGAYVVNYYNMWQSPTCQKSNGGGNINLAAPTASESRPSPARFCLRAVD